MRTLSYADGILCSGLRRLDLSICHFCLQVGSDCPDHAVYVDVASSIDRSTTGSQAGALCLFEDDLSETAWRHTNTGGGCHLDPSHFCHLRCVARGCT